MLSFPQTLSPQMLKPYNQTGVYNAKPFSERQLCPNDTFEKVSDAVIIPNSTKENLILAEINSAGNITQPSLPSRRYLGHLDSQGNYELLGGVKGNLFRDPYLKIDNFRSSEQFYDQSNPLALSIKQAERATSIRNSEIPVIRANLTCRGINGQGIKVGIIDPLKKDSHGQWVSSNHTTLVSRIITDPVWGVAPNAQVLDLGIPNELQSGSASDSVQAYAEKLIKYNCFEMDMTTNQIQRVIGMKDPALRLINITYVGLRPEDYLSELKLLRSKDANGYYQFPNLRAAILGNTVYGTEKQQFAAVQKYLDNVLDNNPFFQQSYQRYVETTRQAAQAGIITVVGVGNEHHKAAFDVPYQPDVELSYQARSPYVISVAASNTNQTPGNRTDDMPAQFSSRGDGYYWNPTITAPGDNIPISSPVGDTGHNLTVNGTSFATPYVCGVIAMMLQINPGLTFEQVKSKLQATAVKNPAYSVAEVGAGFLNPEAAVTSANYA